MNGIKFRFKDELSTESYYERLVLLSLKSKLAVLAIHIKEQLKLPMWWYI